ncbi:MAG: hypothetical protein HYY96_02380 [Candidatus Tectomicrobia bacterium]|nr:hypothetical protein [Candidatus Tectomicrobia bacterium]
MEQVSGPGIKPLTSAELFKKVHHLCGRKRLHVGLFVDLETDARCDESGNIQLLRRITAFRQCTHNDGCLQTCVEIDHLRQALIRGQLAGS